MIHARLLTAFIAIASFLTAGAEISIGVAIPDSDSLLGENGMKMLSSRLKTAVSTCGVASDQWGDFYLVPTVAVTDEKVAETGMRNVYNVTVDLTLNVSQLPGNAEYGSDFWTLKGCGASRQKAISEALGKFRADARFKEFVAAVKGKIEDYFVQNREALLSRAKRLASTQQYDEAIATLYSYPANLQGYETVNAAISDIYRMSLANDCGSLLQAARSAFASHQYEEAAQILADINPQSACAAEAKTLQNEIHSRIQSDIIRSERREDAEKERAAKTESRRLTAIQNMVKAYYKRTWPQYHYHFF